MAKTLSDYTYEEIEAEYFLRKQQRREAREAERAKIKRCRTCRLYGTITATGAPRDTSKPIRPWQSGYCPKVKLQRPTKTGRIYKSVVPCTKACEHYKNKA